MNRWQSVKSYRICKYYDKFNAEAFYNFISVNEFYKIKKGLPYNMKQFLETGKDRYKESNDFKQIGRYVMKGIMFRNHIENINCVIMQPYTYLKPLDIIRSEVMSWADEYNIQAVVYDSRYSWYYPGMTILIIISMPGTEIKVKQLIDHEDREER